MKIIWLDDELITVDTEIEKIKEKNEVHSFSRIARFINFLNTNTINLNDIFIIDILLIPEDTFSYRGKEFKIVEKSLAGFTFVKELLKKNYPENKIIFYTVTVDEIGDNVYGMYAKNLQEEYGDNWKDDFLIIGKPEMNKRFKSALKKFDVKW